jgi:signal peptidase I
VGAFAIISRAVRRRWRVAGIAVLSGLAVAAIAHPDWGAHDYEATHRLYSPAAARDTASGGQTAPLSDPFILGPESIAKLATSRQTAARAAAQLGFDGEPLRLVERVRARADARAGTIDVTAQRRNDPRGAVALADTVAEELIALVDESRATARERAIDEANEQANAIQDQIAALQRGTPTAAARAEELSRQYAAKLAEAEQLSQAADTSGISTINPAVARRLPGRAVESLPPLFGWLLTLLLLAGLGAGLAVAVDLTDDRVADRYAAETITGLPVLAVVPPNGAHPDAAHMPHQQLQQALLGRGAAPESATNSSFVVPKVAGSGRVVLFTSPTHDEAKTETVINFAQAVAATGRTALIVDCDESADGDDETGEPGQRGVGDLAAGGIVLPSLSSLVQSTSMARVSMVPRGSNGAEAAPFLVRHEHLVRSATALADVVILHGPGLLSGDAAAGLARIADDTVLVCRSGETRVADARAAAAALYDAEATAGVVVVDETPPTEPTALALAALLERARTDAKFRGRLEWVAAAIGMFVLYAGMRTFVFESYSIPTASMVPYLEPGDRVLVSKLSFRMHDVHRGDVVVFNTPADARTLGGDKLIKRVIALPGETVESRDGKVYVNDRALTESYLPNATKTENLKRQTVPAGRYLVLGDNRDNSADSRFFGTIRRGAIVGRAWFHIWPWPIGFM